jgi:hypothetical protein
LETCGPIVNRPIGIAGLVAAPLLSGADDRILSSAAAPTSKKASTNGICPRISPEGTIPDTGYQPRASRMPCLPPHTSKSPVCPSPRSRSFPRAVDWPQHPLKHAKCHEKTPFCTLKTPSCTPFAGEKTPNVAPSIPPIQPNPPPGISAGPRNLSLPSRLPRGDHHSAGFCEVSHVSSHGGEPCSGAVAAIRPSAVLHYPFPLCCDRESCPAISNRLGHRPKTASQRGRRRVVLRNLSITSRLPWLLVFRGSVTSHACQ